ncbi:hypothetical protein VNO77_09167 [Canavalia gladiata]|uniref:Uncharacterized protein n=1 Tax=Canavalia gladiata TaxID=3824 RepID=A0AAN9R1B2_CANGL
MVIFLTPFFLSSSQSPRLLRFLPSLSPTASVTIKRGFHFSRHGFFLTTFRLRLLSLCLYQLSLIYAKT